MRKVFLDCEMYKKHKNDAGEVISVGAICGDESFSSLIQPRTVEVLPYWLTFMTGINERMLDEAPTFEKVIRELLDFCEDDCEIFVYGTSDIPALVKTFHLNDGVFLFSKSFKNDFYRFIDKVTDIKKQIISNTQSEKESLEGVYFELFKEYPTNSHSAIDDAKTLQKIVQKIGGFDGEKDL